MSCEPCEAGVVFTPSASGLTKPAVDVDGLEAYTNYTFAVEAHNGVSGMGPAPQRTAPAVWVAVGHAGQQKQREVLPAHQEKEEESL